MKITDFFLLCRVPKIALWNVIILGLISIIMIFNSSYYILCSIFLNFYIVRRWRVCYTLCWNSKVILTIHKNLLAHLFIELTFCTILISVCCVFYCIALIFDQIVDDVVTVNLQIFVITIFIWTGIIFLKKLTYYETSYLSTINKLTLGYGGAIWHYKNYLSRIMPENFLAGLEQFENTERVELPPKLYLLCPKSCKVKNHIDNTDNIEDSKYFSALKIDHGGIKGRVYRVSVYRIKNNGEYFRCVLEYAQPLKNLLTLKENGTISLSEMYTERERFIKYLSQLLRDRKNSCDVCELVEYDDEIHEIPDVLSSLASIQNYKRRTEE